MLFEESEDKISNKLIEGMEHTTRKTLPQSIAPSPEQFSKRTNYSPSSHFALDIPQKLEISSLAV